ncbi:hypothetical protein [Francisella philomiragia]|uniref:hypothetical protein n=1 Tax=Francisella philomiragia TaxID=28110 RepID=UPI0022443F8C|nr:hypothetical protein [Francisella philomiragia]
MIKYKNFNLRISDLENKVGTLRDLKQAVDEAPSLRSHIVFKFIKDPNSEEYRTFVALEQSTGINITAVTSLLQNHTKNKEKKITIRDTSKEIKPNKITFFSHVKYISPSSETLEQIIKNGQLSRVKVVTSSYKSDDNESTPVKRYKETSDIIQFPKGYKHVEKAISKVKGLLCDKVDENAEKILYVTIKDKYTNTDEFDAKKDRDINDIKNLFCHKQEYLPFQNGIIEPTYKKVKDDIVNKVLDKVISDEKLKTYIETI